MKYVLLWMAILGIAIGVAVWAEAQPSGPMHGGSSMMGQGIMGGKTYVSQVTGEAASNYSSLCASCHGATGQGNGPAATALNPKPKDFADCKTMAKTTDETLFKAIHGGGQTVGLSPMMPAWGASLTEQQIHDLVRHIRGFCKK
jgi:cytochrome c oxidase cbb3-type subunit III